MKKLIFLLMAILLVFCLTSCGEESETVVLNVYNWGEYISDGFQGSLDSNKAFEEYFNKNLSEKYG